MTRRTNQAHRLLPTATVERKGSMGIKKTIERKKGAAVLVERVVSLRRKATTSLRYWMREMRRAEKELRSGDERIARDQVTWLKGYLKGLRHAEQANPPACAVSITATA